MKIIIGSTALEYRGLDIVPKDLDIFTDESWTSSDYDITEMPASILELIPADYDRFNFRDTIGSDAYVATLDACYTILMSHFGWDSGKNDHSKLGGSLQWDKFKSRILHLQSIGCKVIVPLYDALVEHWKEKFGNKEFLNMNKSKDEFFNDHVTYKIDHDELHKMIVAPELPTYNLALKDGHDVTISQLYFDKLSHQQHIDMFREEIAVIAIERYVLLSDDSYSLAWHKSLKKTITSLTKNWATEFIIFNLKEFIQPQMKYFINFKENHIMTDTKKTFDFSEFYSKHENSTLLKDSDMSSAESIISSLVGMGEGYVRDKDKAFFTEHDLSVILTEGGDEGGTEHCYMIFKHGDTVYKITYSYFSYEGNNFDNDVATEVVAKEKTITVYE